MSKPYIRLDAAEDLEIVVQDHPDLEFWLHNEEKRLTELQKENKE